MSILEIILMVLIAVCVIAYVIISVVKIKRKGSKPNAKQEDEEE